MTTCTQASYVGTEVVIQCGGKMTKKVGFPRGDVVRPLWPAPAFRRSSAVPGLASRVGVGVPMLRATRTW